MVEFTGSAAAKVVELLQREGRDDLRLRVSVQPGGCAGLRYGLWFDTSTGPGDEMFEQETPAGLFAVVVDQHSSPYLTGVVVDYADTLERQGFIIDNPNAGGSCSCGESFH